MVKVQWIYYGPEYATWEKEEDMWEEYPNILTSYAENKKAFRDFKLAEHVFLKVKEKISSIRLGSWPKLAARYCGPFEILEKIGPIAYILAFHASMRVHNAFHVSLLKKYVPDVNHVIYWNVTQM